jgi:hypothetical protein
MRGQITGERRADVVRQSDLKRIKRNAIDFAVS